MNKRKFRMILLASAFLFTLLVMSQVQEVQAAPEEPNGGGSPYDNYVINPRFEYGDLLAWDDLGGRGSIEKSTTEYEGTYSLKMKNVRPTFPSLFRSTGGHAVGQETNIPVQAHTMVGGALRIHGNAEWVGTSIGIHIYPADVRLVYYVSNVEHDDWDNRYLDKVGDLKDTWYHFYSNVANDLSAIGVDITTDPQSIENIILAVESKAYFTESADGYIDDLYIGSTPPSLDIDYPSDNQWISGDVLFNGDAGENRGQGYSATMYAIDPVLPWFPIFEWAETTGTTSWSVDVDTTTLTEGNHKFYVWAIDGTTDSVRQDITFKVDNTDPILDITSHSGTTWVKGSVTISGTSDDALSGIDTVRLKIGTGSWIPLSPTASWSYAWDTTAIDDGTYTITVEAVDEAGNTDSETLTMKVDNTGPTIGTPTVVPVYGPLGTTFTIRIPSITDDGVGLGLNAVTVSISDPNGDPVDLQILPTSTIAEWAGSITLGSTDLQGTYTIDSIEVVDKLGNPSTITTDLFFVFDRTNPTVALTSHSNNDILSGTVVLGGTITDSVSGLDRFEIYMNGDIISNDTNPSASWTYTLNTVSLDDGYYMFHFKAIDKARNSHTIYVFLIVRNEDGFVAPFIPVVNEQGIYITSCRVMVGDSQVVLALSIPLHAQGEEVRVMIPEPYMTMWSVSDLTYVSESGESVSILGYATWNEAGHYLSFPRESSGSGYSLSGKSLTVALEKMGVTWALSIGDQHIEQHVTQQLTITALDTDGNVPFGLPSLIELYVIQDNSLYHLGNVEMDVTGSGTFSFTIGNNPFLEPGEFSMFVKFSDSLYVLYDMTTTTSSSFDGFFFYEETSWSFNPTDDIITRYSATVYDQRLVTVYVHLVDSTGSSTAMIGQGVRVTIVGPNVNDVVTIYQALHSGGMYALFEYNLTDAGSYSLTFDFEPSDYFVDLDDHNIIVNLVHERPVHIDLAVPSEIDVGSSILMEAALTDDWASDFPIANNDIMFGYISDGSWVYLGTTQTDGYGLARFLWTPDELLWRSYAGNSIEFTANFSGGASYSPEVVSMVSPVGLMNTYIQMPIVTPDQINAGDSITVNLLLYDFFGTAVTGSLDLDIAYPDGTIESFIVYTDINSTFSIPLPDWGNYSFTANFLGSSIYTEYQVTQGVTVLGSQSILVINSTPDTSGIAGEFMTIDFALLDIHGSLLLNSPLHVAMKWMDQENYYTVITGVNSSIDFSPEISGELIVECWFNGDQTYEPSTFSRVFPVERRPVEVTLSGVPDYVNPYVDPSQLTYDLSAVVIDPATGLPISEVGVLFCYIMENETVLIALMNSTGYLNLSLVENYLAWGLFRGIGAGLTDASGIATVGWQVNVTTEQEFSVFAITLQTDTYGTGVSTTYPIEFRRIATAVDIESSWTGEDKNVDISASLWDQFSNYLPGMQITIQARSYFDPTVILFETNYTTALDGTITWNAPDFGAYNITAWFAGDTYYLPSHQASVLVVVSWRHVDLELDMPEEALPGDTIELSVDAIDLNGTADSELLEPLVVYFGYFEHGVLNLLGSAETGSDNSAAIYWEVPLESKTYNVFAFSRRQWVYDVGVSEFHELFVGTMDTILDIDVKTTWECPLNITYSFNVSLTDAYGNSLDGEKVTLYLTDNYTMFWGPLDFDATPTNITDSDKCHGNPHWHFFKLTVIIGLNDTFSWSIPGRVSDRILFAPRAIVVARYDGGDSYSPSIFTRKMSCLLNETDTEIILTNNPLRLQAGVPQEIQVRVIDEYGRILDRYYVNITILGPNGYLKEIQIDLSKSNSTEWIPEYSGYHTIIAEFLGGDPFGHNQNLNKGRWHNRFRHLFDLLLTRSFGITRLYSTPADATLSVDAIPTVNLSGDEVQLTATLHSNLGLAVIGTTVDFYYLDSQGTIIHIGTSVIDGFGKSTLNWTLPESINAQGYESVFLIVEVSSDVYHEIIWASDRLLQIWPKPEDSGQYTEPLELGPTLQETYSDPMMVPAMFCLLAIVGAPMSVLSRQKKRFFMLFMAVFLIFCMSSLLYAGMGLESHAHPYEADLIYNVSTNPTGPSGKTYTPQPVVEDQNELISHSGALHWNYATSVTPETGLADSKRGFATGTPNATYIVVPLTQTLDLNFTAYGHYVVSILDSDRNPVDTVAGFASGNVSVSFRISPSMYIVSEHYTVNTFVTVQRGGILYGDTSWVVMTVSPCATAIDLLLESDIVQYWTTSQEFTMASRLTQLYTNASISDAEVNFYYRSARNLQWYELGTAVTNENGIASIDWDLSLPKDSYIINATYFGNNFFASSMTVKLLTVDGAGTQIGPAPHQPLERWVQYAHPVDITARLLSSTSTGLFNKTIDYFIVKGDKEHWIGSNRTDIEGVSTFSYTPFVDRGVYDIRVYFEGDGDNAASEYVFIDGLHVEKRLSDISAVTDEIIGVNGDTVDIIARFSDDLGSPIAAKDVFLEIYHPNFRSWDTIEYSKTDPSGLVKFNYLIAESAGQYIYRINLIGDNTTARTSYQGLLTVIPEPTELYFIPVSLAYGQTKTIWAHLQNSDGKPMDGKTLLYYLDVDSNWILIGSTLTDGTGWAGLSWTAEYGERTYDMKVLYPGSSSDLASEHIDTGVTIYKAESRISLNVPKKVQYTFPADINATITDALGTPLVHKKIQLDMSVQGFGLVESVKVYSDENGHIYYRYISPYLGVVTITATFAGDEYYTSNLVSEEMEAGKIEISLSITVSQVSAHRGDTLFISGTASFYNPADDEVIPADEGISFLLEFENGVVWSDQDYSITTGKEGRVTGEWTIPLDSDIQADDYIFRITPISSGFGGETTFSLTLIERTSLTIQAMRGSVPISEQYVEQSVDFRFTLVDEDSDVITNAEVVYSIDDSRYTEVIGNTGYIIFSDFKPTRAGGLYVSSSYAGSKWYDPHFTDLSLNVARRSIIPEDFSTNATYFHRGDSIYLNLDLIDFLDSGNLIDPVPLTVMVDGNPIANFDEYLGLETILTQLPDGLQSGPHTVTYQISESRVYEAVERSLEIYAYEQTITKLVLPNRPKTHGSNYLRVCLADEDGTPLEGRYVTLTVWDPKNRNSVFNIKTDQFGEATHNWEPTLEGDYQFEAWFGGESLFDGTSQNAIPSSMKYVQDGSGKSEEGTSPLWMLPLMLLTAVAIFVEYLSFGFISFLWAEAKIDDEVMTVKRIAYPAIQLQEVEVTLPIIGKVKLVIPIPYIHTTNDIDVKSPSGGMSYSEGHDTESRFDLNGGNLEDGFQPSLNALSKGVLEGDNSVIDLQDDEPSDDFTGPSRTVTTSELNIEILAPNSGTRFSDVPNVTVIWKVDYPINANDMSSRISVDHGQFQTVSPKLEYDVEEEGVHRAFYEMKYDAIRDFWDLGRDNLENGGHRVVIEAEADGVAESTSTIFYIFNIASFFVAGLIFLIFLVLGYVIQKIAAHFFEKVLFSFEGISRAISGAAWTVFTIMLSLLTFILLGLVYDLIASFVGGQIWGLPIAGLTFGVIMAFLTIILAVFFFRKATAVAGGTRYEGAEKRLKALDTILTWVVPIQILTSFAAPILVTHTDEDFTPGLPDGAEVFIDFLVIIVETFAMTKLVSDAIFDAFEFSKYAGTRFDYKSVRDVGAIMGKAMGYASLGIAFLSTGLNLLARTYKEVKHTWP